MANLEHREKTADVKDTLKNPPEKFSLTVHNKEFPTESFNDDEATIFQNQFNQILAQFDSQLLTSLLIQREDTLAKIAANAKHLTQRNFGGVDAGDNELGMSVLRPGHIRSDPSQDQTVINDWYFDANQGWQDYIGDGTAARDYPIPEDVTVAIFAVGDDDTSTELSALNVDRFGRNLDMLPKDLNNLRNRDNETEQMVQATPTLLGQDGDRVHIRARADAAGESRPRLYGVCFAPGKFLNNEDYSWSDL